MARRTYTDRDKAIVFAELTVNDGNVKRTARNTGYDVSAVRRWKMDWERNGVPPAVQEEVEIHVSDFLTDAMRIRGKLLHKIEEALDRGDKVTLPQVSTAFGILSDKIRAYEAISQTQKVEHTFQLPPAEEMKELFSGIIGGMANAARNRAAEIEAIEEPIVTTYHELPMPEEDVAIHE